MLAACFVSLRFLNQLTDPLSRIPESGKGRGESDGGDTEPRILFPDSSSPIPLPDSPIPVSRFRVKGSGIRVQNKMFSSRCSAYSTLNLKNAALSSGANSRQMLPSTTDTESGFRVRGAKVFRSVDSKRLSFICTLPASFKPMV